MKNLLLFCEWYNSIPFLFSVSKKKPVPFDGKSVHRNFRTNGKRSKWVRKEAGDRREKRDYC